MAIVEMKRLLLVADRSSQEGLLLVLQRLGCVEITPFDAEEGMPELPAQGRQQELSKADQAIARARFAIQRLNRFSGEKNALLSAKPGASLAALSPGDQDLQEAEALLQQIEALERVEGEIRGRQTRLRGQLDLLAPWEALDIPGDSLADSRHSRQYLGSLPKAALPQLTAETASWPVHIEVVSQPRENAYLWAIAHTAKAGEFQDLLKEHGFTPAQLGDDPGTPAQQMARIQQQLEALEKERLGVQDKLTELARSLPKLRLYHDQMLSLRERLQAEARLLHTRDTLLLKGWLPAELEKSFLQEIAKEYPGAVVSLSDPEEGEEPPVLLKNNPVAAPFETVVTGFSYPSPKGLDPTGVVMPFFACFFGMMVSDAGYGLMMMILVPLLIRMMKPSEAGRKLFWVIGIGGVFTLFWGFMYNTWFGFNPMANPPLDPIGRPMEVMVLCLAVGALHLLAGLALGIAQNIRRGAWLDVVYDQLSWLMILAGLGMLAVPGLAGIGKWLALAGALIVALFAGREKPRPISRLISGLGALYGVTGWLSDLLSYMRLFGMGLATGVIGMVINILIGMVFATGPVGWVIGAALFVGGHLFNAGINILGAYVHSARLQYIEFFGKFYQEGGRPFRPLTHNPRFVRISDA